MFSGYIERVSRKEIRDYLSSFGTFPYQTSNWTENDLNFTKIEAELNFEFFVRYKINLCQSPRSDAKIFCLEHHFYNPWDRFYYRNKYHVVRDIEKMFEALDFPTENVVEMFENLNALNEASVD